MLTAQRVFTSLAIVAAGATVFTAALLLPGQGTPAPAHGDIAVAASTPSTPASDDGLTITAHLQATGITSAAHDEDILIDVQAAMQLDHVRPPLSLVIVIDHSGSMEGKPLADAEDAAIKLVDRLEPQDQFSIVGFSSRAELVSKMTTATDDGKRGAKAAIAHIHEGGGTCTSCGLDLAVNQLADVETRDGRVRRIVLMSDGHANEGLWDPSELVAYADRIAHGGTSMTTVGVGLDFDEVMMTKMAEVGRGNYYFVEDTAQLDAMFTRELGGLADTIASNVHVVLRDLPGAQALDAIGYPSTREGHSLVIPFADLRSGEGRKVVVRVHVAPGASAKELLVSQPEVQWSGVGAARGDRHAFTTLQASITDDATTIAASVNHGAVQAVEDARSARALDEAAVVYEKQGYAAAAQVIQQNQAAVHARAAALGDAKAMTKFDNDSGEALEMLKTMPAPKAAKSVRKKSYDLAR